MKEKVKKSKMTAEFLGNNADYDIEKARFCPNFLAVEKNVLNIVWSRSRNQNLPKVGTGTATNRYGSTKLVLGTVVFVLCIMAVLCVVQCGPRIGLPRHNRG
jgi:hypothetical protein